MLQGIGKAIPFRVILERPELSHMGHGSYAFGKCVTHISSICYHYYAETNERCSAVNASLGRKWYTTSPDSDIEHTFMLNASLKWNLCHHRIDQFHRLV